MSAMTESEAKTKWCPFARLSETGGYNRCGPAANLECIGSACMAWQTTSTNTYLDGKLLSQNQAIIGDGNNVRRELVGHCGLAG